MNSNTYNFLFHNSIRYFNVENYLTTFINNWNEISNKPTLFINFFQNTIGYYTFNSIQNIRILSLNQFTQDFFLKNLFKGNTLINPSYITNKNLYFITENLYGSLKIQVKDFYEIESLRIIFPEFREDLEMFEVLSYNVDGSLYNTLSTPNVKLLQPQGKL